ncbi:AraC family transcriptional regulator [Aquabacterium sp.]|uniref:AraC family transcriptional regulator n=2 Tax=Aquabacterium sp. TaxID=1872578 RepID=UPI0035B1FCC9
MTLQATVSMSWVQTVLGEARRQGLDDATVLAAAGIRQEELTRERWPIDHITRLWRAAARLSHDPGFGLKAGSLVGPASFNVVSFILQSAASLRQALTVIQKYQSLVSDGGRFQLLAGADASWLVYHPRQGDLAFSPHQLEAVLAAVVSATQWITHQPIRPSLVRFSHERIGPLAGYRQVFACPVEFSQAYSGLLIPNRVLDHPLPQANAQLAQVHEQYAAAQLHSLSQGQTFDQAVYQWISTHMGPPPPTRVDVAQAFGLTERTLARRLQACQTSYVDILDQVRRDWALQQLSGTDRPMLDVAHSLGFAELSPFYRAFQRWTGMTPGQWRQQG